ncbi:MAG: hypothetical protein GPJ54_09150 [Candidatus Heimdallarchaeota archaeon]|nr:hypothetical protein [Candidatus Heimdallarchaeota archaeon]
MSEKEYKKLKRTSPGEVISSYVKIPKSVRDNFSNNQSKILASLFGVPVVILFLLPLFSGRITGTGFYLNSLTLAALFGAMALTLNLEAGFLGLPNFGKVAFIAVGGYSYAIFTVANYGKMNYTLLVIIGLIIAMVVTSLFGVLLTLPTLKLREDYLAIVTIVAGEIVRNIFNNEASLGGYNGFKVKNPVYQLYDSDLMMGGLLINWLHAIIIIAMLALSYLVYYRNVNKKIEHLPQERQEVQSIGKATNIFFILGAIVIYLNYAQILSSEAIFGLDMMILIIGGLMLLYRAVPKKPSGEIFFAIVAGLTIINYVIGLFGNYGTKFKFIEWYTLMLAVGGMAITFVIVEELYYSPFGRTLKSIREDETSAISVGKSVFNYRLRALMISSALSGFAGALYAINLVQINPNAYIPALTFTLYIMMIIGGTANNKGVVFGAIVIQLLYSVTRGTLVADSQFFKDAGLDPSNLGLIFVGVTLILFLLFAPEGIFPEKRYNNQRYYDMLHYNDEENAADSALIAQLIKLSGTELETEEWITSD